jgi:hypothetical protein
MKVGLQTLSSVFASIMMKIRASRGNETEIFKEDNIVRVSRVAQSV